MVKKVLVLCAMLGLLSFCAGCCSDFFYGGWECEPYYQGPAPYGPPQSGYPPSYGGYPPPHPQAGYPPQPGEFLEYYFRGEQHGYGYRY